MDTTARSVCTCNHGEQDYQYPSPEEIEAFEKRDGLYNYMVEMSFLDWSKKMGFKCIMDTDILRRSYKFDKNIKCVQCSGDGDVVIMCGHRMCRICYLKKIYTYSGYLQYPECWVCKRMILEPALLCFKEGDNYPHSKFVFERKKATECTCK